MSRVWQMRIPGYAFRFPACAESLVRYNVGMGISGHP